MKISKTVRLIAITALISFLITIYYVEYYGNHSNIKPNEDELKMLLTPNNLIENKNSVSNTIAIQKELNQNPLIFWSSDFHISTIADIKSTLQNYNIKFIDKSLSNHCHLTNTCERDLKIIHKLNGINLGQCPNKMKRDFYNEYRCNSEILSVDAFLCTHATSMCELFMPFNTSLIVIAATRYEIGRYDTKRWNEWNINLQKIASNPYNIVAANNKYDLEYIKYFTNIQNVLLLPSYCGYIQNKYLPTRPEILITPARGVNSKISKELFDELKLYKESNNNIKLNNKIFGNDELKIVHIRDLYSYFKYTDISSHPALIILPYQVSFMSFFEFYRMEVPMFVPTPELLAKWHLLYGCLNERSWSTVHGMPSSNSAINKHQHSSSAFKYDPNNELDYDAILEWIKLADFYEFPHIIQFNSWSELFSLLVTTDLNYISKKMKEYNIIEYNNVIDSWNKALQNVIRGKKYKRSAFISSSTSNDCYNMPLQYDEALNLSYSNSKISLDCIG